MSDAKISVSKKAIGHIEKKLTKDMVLGIGTGSTVNFFISELAKYKGHFYGAVSSSEASTKLLQEAILLEAPTDRNFGKVLTFVL